MVDWDTIASYNYTFISPYFNDVNQSGKTGFIIHFYINGYYRHLYGYLNDSTFKWNIDLYSLLGISSS